jgi:hypothetical protein
MLGAGWGDDRGQVRSLLADMLISSPKPRQAAASGQESGVRKSLTIVLYYCTYLAPS